MLWMSNHLPKETGVINYPCRDIHYESHIMAPWHYGKLQIQHNDSIVLSTHYSDITWDQWRLESMAMRFSVRKRIQAKIKEKYNTTLLVHKGDTAETVSTWGCLHENGTGKSNISAFYVSISLYKIAKIHVPLCHEPLTHWGRDKMDAISQTTLSRAFSSMKIVVFW